jgi:hypothetical protein
MVLARLRPVLAPAPALLRVRCARCALVSREPGSAQAPDATAAASIHGVA